MVEKIRLGLAGDVVYRLTREEVIAILKQQGTYDCLSRRQIQHISSGTICPIPEKIPQIEEMIRKAGLPIIDPASN